MSKRRFPGIHQLPLVIIKLSSAVRAKTGLPAPPLYNAEVHCMQMQKRHMCKCTYTNTDTQTQIQYTNTLQQIQKPQQDCQPLLSVLQNCSACKSPNGLALRVAVIHFCHFLKNLLQNWLPAPSTNRELNKG